MECSVNDSPGVLRLLRQRHTAKVAQWVIDWIECWCFRLRLFLLFALLLPVSFVSFVPFCSLFFLLSNLQFFDRRLISFRLLLLVFLFVVFFVLCRRPGGLLGFFDWAMVWRAGGLRDVRFATSRFPTLDARGNPCAPLLRLLCGR